MSNDAPIESLPGYRRRFRITSSPGQVLTELEDDYHCMAVRIVHDGETAIALEAEMDRAPWTTCPGAVAKLRETFSSVRLDSFVARGEKNFNCTHLHDLATLGAAHAADRAPSVYDILVSDPVDGVGRAELRRDGSAVMRWTLEGLRLRAPAELAGMSLFKLGPWIAAQPAEVQERARLLRWGVIVGHGRAIPLSEQSDPRKYPGNCYTFQPETAARAIRVGEIREFSRGMAEPLDRRPEPAPADAR